MALKKKSSLLIFLALANFAYAKSKLPTLETKQSRSNIRYLTNDGKFTYYRRANGTLQFSTNYKVEQVLKYDPGTHYSIVGTPNKKYVLVSANPEFNRYFSIRNPLDIHAVKMGTNRAIKLGAGIDPRLHLQDRWASFFNPYQRTINIIDIEKPKLTYEINLANIRNPYFTPEVVMIDNNTVLYTDLNKKGHLGLLIYTLNKKKFKLVYKVPSHTVRLELCKWGQQLYIGEFGIDPLEKGSIIRMLNTKKLDISQSKTLYESDQNDIGQIICSIAGSNLYFIKTLVDKEGKQTYEAVQHNMKKKETKVISDLKFSNQLVNMDGKLLIPYHGEYYVLLGENNMTQFDLINFRSE
jgi:hypothetical protein